MNSPSITLPQATEARARRLPAVMRRLCGCCGRSSCAGIAWMLCLGCLLAVLLRWTWKDSLPAFAPFYYATPLALIWAGIAAAGGLFWLSRKPRLAVIAGLCAVLCWGWWQNGLTTAGANNGVTPSFQALFWNTARLKAGWEDVAERMHQMESPIMAFVEAGPDDSESRARWREEFPAHEPVFFGNGMVLLVQGTVTGTEQGSLSNRCYYGLANVEIQGKPLTLILVDLYSNPFYSRAEAFASLQELIQKHQGEPVLLMGDFNTPADSVHCGLLRGELRNAFECAGQGRAETWPAPFPVLAIDQVWVNSGIAVHRTRYVCSLESDHRAVIAELAFSE